MDTRKCTASSILAVYFFLDSMAVAVHLSRKQIHRQAEGMTFDVVLTAIAYSYIVYRQYVDWRSNGQGGEQTEDAPTSDIQEQVATEGVV